MLHFVAEVTSYVPHQSIELIAKEYCVALTQLSWTATPRFVMFKQYVKRLVSLMLGGCSHVSIHFTLPCSKAHSRLKLAGAEGRAAMKTSSLF